MNHVDFNGANQGKHKFVTMPEQTDAPDTLENEGAIYSKDFSGVTQLFWKNAKQPPDEGTEQQLTNTLPNIVNGPDLLANSNWNFADGFQTRFGRVKFVSGFLQVTFLTSFSVPPYSVQITPVGASAVGNWNVQNVLNTGFEIHNTIAGEFYYMAIGTN